MRNIFYLISILITGTCTCSFAQDSTRNQIEQVVVTAQLEATSLKNSVYKIRTITQDQIMRRGTTDMSTLLNTELGIRINNDMMLGESDIELMGMSGQNVKILIDGVPLLDRGAERQSLMQIDVNMIEKIEIIEGPVSVTYGTDALAGVINIITKNNLGGHRWRISARVLEETVGSEYAPLSGEGRHNAHLGISHHVNRWDFDVNASRNTFGGWQGSATLPQLQWQPKDQWLASGKIGYQGSKHQTWYRFDYVNEDIFTPGRFNPNNTQVNQNFISNRYNNMLQSNWKFSEKLTANGSFSLQNYDRRTVTQRTNFQTSETETLIDNGQADIARFNTLFFRGTTQYQFSEKVHAQFGLEWNSQSGSGDRLTENASVSEYATFLTAEIRPMGWLNIRPGVRFIGNNVFQAIPIIPSLNVKLSLDQYFDIRAAYAKGFRSPALRELYFSFFDTNHSIIGSPNLRPENSNSFNTYLSYHRVFDEVTNINTSLGGFHNTFNDMIAIGFEASNPTVNTYVNIERFKTTGLIWEGSVTYRSFQAGLGFSYIGRYNISREVDPSLPELLWSPEINSNLSYYYAPWGLNASLFFKFYGRRPRFEFRSDDGGIDEVHQVFVDGFNMSDLTLNKKINRLFSLSGGVRNLFNVKDLRNTGTMGEGPHGGASPTVPMAYGRSYFLGLQFNMTQ
ncbi:TonB-dependent receptor [Sphingobacterium sp. lm-10]|uniref:TonB-dependent receptor plug domain-containing protein n=1 Tax=Sphingobacterium sp. lm-10 TaxID=2944904 RepID=UPI002020B26C|nr:TonB-dependent receptor [Sphingobacterium sp. lm-10]MCL7988931.1 TonB-dependent receptor [Sphingobacterium sp. lm-10]